MLASVTRLGDSASTEPGAFPASRLGNAPLRRDDDWHSGSVNPVTESGE